MNTREANNWIFFIISPFISLPYTLRGIYKRSPVSIAIFIVLLGVMSYLYVPHFTNDKTRYYEFYLEFANLSWADFINDIFKTRPDFLLHMLFFISCKIGLPIQFVFMLVTSITGGFIFYVFYKTTELNNVKNNKIFFLSFLLIFLSLSLKDFFSGIRFYFAISFVLFGFYKGLIESKKKAFIYLIIASFIHFSAILLLGIYLFNVLIKNPKVYKWLYVVSILFILIPKEYLFDILMNNFSFGSGLETKVQTYLAEDDFIEGGIIEGSSSYYYIYLVSISWSIFAYIYLLSTLKKASLYRNFVYSAFFFINIFYQVTTVYARYLLFAGLLFSLLMIVEANENKKNRKYFYILLSLYGLNFVNNLIVLRDNLSESYANGDLAFLFTALLRIIDYKDILNY